MFACWPTLGKRLLTAVLQKHSKQRAAMADAEQEAAASKIAAIKRGK
jgi:hypothetical protein